MLLIVTIPWLPCRFVSHPSLLRQEWLGNSWLIGDTWTGPSRMGVPGLLGVGQSVFSSLLLLCEGLQVCSLFGGKGEQHFDISPARWPFSAHWQHVCLTVSFTYRYCCDQRRHSLDLSKNLTFRQFFFSSANVLAFIIQRAVELFSLTSP